MPTTMGFNKVEDGVLLLFPLRLSRASVWYFPLPPFLSIPVPTFDIHTRSFVLSSFPHPRKTRTNDDSVQSTGPVRVDLRHAPLSLSILNDSVQVLAPSPTLSLSSFIPLFLSSFLSSLIPLVFPISRFPVICMVLV